MGIRWSHETDEQFDQKMKEYDRQIDDAYSHTGRSNSGGGFSFGFLFDGFFIPFHKRTTAAQFLLRSGHIALIGCAVVWFFNLSHLSMFNYPLLNLLLIAGITFCSLVYFAELFGTILIFFAVFVIYGSGDSTEGFSFSSITPKEWLLSLGILFTGIFVGKVFGVTNKINRKRK